MKLILKCPTDNFDSGNSLATNNQQSINWTNVDKDPQYRMVSLGRNELTEI